MWPAASPCDARGAAVALTTSSPGTVATAGVRDGRACGRSLLLDADAPRSRPAARARGDAADSVASPGLEEAEREPAGP